jgi:hypothetical protein
VVRIFLLGVVLILSGVIRSTAAPDPPPDLAGMYRCDGKNPDGTAYQGVVEITKLRDTFRVAWKMDDGSVLGVGIYSGGVFAVSYFGGAPAVVVYKVDGNRLVGEWTMGGIDGAVYAETLTKTASAPSQRDPGRQDPPKEEPRRPTKPAGGVQL